jgi:hypothetical protein
VIGRLLALAMLFAVSARAQHYAQRFWFDDGAGVELRTETTRSIAKTDVSGGGMISWDEATHDDKVSRYVLDSHDKTIFAYGLQASRGPGADEITIRLNPFGTGPTVAALREFKAVKYGQEVKIEILANPSTGERVFDVLRPVEGPSPSPGHRAVEAVSVPRLTVNGNAIAVKSSWATGQPARLSVPGHGAFYLSWESRPKSRLAGYIEKNRLIFLVDSEYVEMTFPGNVLGMADGGPVWVYHDPGFVPENQGGAVCLLDSYR